MKRVYVRPQFRGQKLGKTMAETLISFAKSAGYSCMLLDTLSDMAEARKMYVEVFGFREIPPYYENPLEGTLYLKLDLISIR